MSLLTQMKFSFVSSGMADDTFTVVSFKGFEAISKPYEFEILLVSDKTDIDPLNVLQNPAVFSIHRDGEENVDFNGILMQFEETSEFDGYLFYKALLAPKFKWLALTHHNQVFLDQSVPEIMEDALKDGGLVSGIDFEFRLKESYPTFEYICQYDESHFDFVTRWAQREGMYYFFEQTPNGEKLVLTDTKVSHVDLLLGKDLIYEPPSGLDAAHTKEVIKSFMCSHNMLPAKIHLKDYNYLRPSQAIEGIADVDENGRGENYIYGVNFNTPEEGNRLARIRAEALLCRKSVFHGESAVPYMVPGFTFDLNDYYKDNYNTKYLVTDVRHEGHQKGYLTAGLGKAVEDHEEQMFYSNTFEAIYSDRQFRAEHTAQKPKIAGTINARIDAAGSGEYAEIDEHGRYKVILPFDRSGRFNGKASSWFRMIQPYAGPNQGMHFPLHKGTEVMLTFIDGDPDQPVIAGAVPNPETASPVTAQNQTKSVIQTGRSPHDSSAGAGDATARTNSHPNNYIAFNDMADHEAIEVHSPYKVDVFAGGKYARREIGPSEETGHDKYEKEDTDGSGTFDPISIPDAETDIDTLKTNIKDYAPSNAYGYDEKATLDPGSDTPPPGFPEEYEKAPVSSPPQDFIDFFAENGLWLHPTDPLEDVLLSNPDTTWTDLLLSGYVKTLSEVYSGATEAWEEYWKYWVPQSHSNAQGYEAGVAIYKNPLDEDNPVLLPAFVSRHWIPLDQLGQANPGMPGTPVTLVDKAPRYSTWDSHCSSEWTTWVDKRIDDWKRWQVHVVKGHVRASHRDTFNTQEGNIYDFGGYWSYSLGNCYNEDHMDQHAELNDSPRFDFLDIGGPHWDKFEELTPQTDPQIPCAHGFHKSKNELDAWGKGTWSNGNVWVDKKFGDSYEYTDGNAISVHKGHTQDIIIGGRTVEEKYGKDPSGKYVKRSYFKSGGGESWTKKWTKTGFLQSDVYTYTTGANYEIKNTLAYNYGASTNLSWDFTSSASLSGKLGAHTDNKIFLGATQDFSFKGAASLSIDLSLAAKANISADASLFFKMGAGAGIGIKIEAKPQVVTYNLHKGHFRWEGPGTEVQKKADLEADMNKLILAASKANLEKQDIHFSSGNVKLVKSELMVKFGISIST